MDGRDLYTIVFAILLFLLPLTVYGAVCLVRVLRAEHAETRADANLIGHAPDTVPLAHATWAAHVAVQKFDGAVLMGDTPRIMRALDEAELEAWKLCDVLDGLKGKPHAHEKR